MNEISIFGIEHVERAGGFDKYAERIHKAIIQAQHVNPYQLAADIDIIRNLSDKKSESSGKLFIAIYKKVERMNAEKRLEEAILAGIELPQDIQEYFGSRKSESL